MPVTDAMTANEHVQAEEKKTDRLASLLCQPTRLEPVSAAMLPSILLGKIVAVDETGQARIHLPSIAVDPIPALSLCALREELIGHTCAVQLIDGDASRPLIIGMVHAQSEQQLQRDTATDSSHSTLTVTQNGKRVEINAAEELVLQCGETRIVMSSDGLIEIRAPYIDSHALATQRVRGGSVQIN